MSHVVRLSEMNKNRVTHGGIVRVGRSALVFLYDTTETD